MLTSYLKLAIRNLGRHKGYTFINISGLAIGMACCLLIMLWIQDETGFDRFNTHADNMYRVLTLNADDPTDVAAVSAGILGKAVKDDVPEVIGATRVMPWSRRLVEYMPSDQESDHVSNEERGTLVDTDFFEMFTYPFLRGDPESAFSELKSIIVTEGMAARFFGRDDPIGNVVTVNSGDDFIVSGVIEDIPSNSHLQFDFLIPFDNLLQWSGPGVNSWTNVSFYTYLMLQEGASVQDVNTKMMQLVDANDPEKHSYILQPLTQIHLYSNFAFDIGGHGDIRYVYIFSAVALLTLLIACINFMNLSTARSTQRAGEIGLRKVVGAHRTQLISQFLGESLLLSLIGVALAYNIVVLVLPDFNAISGKELTLNISNIPYLLSLLVIALGTGVVAGCYPAVYLSSFQPIKVLKKKGASDSKTLLVREILVSTQIALAIILIIGTAVVSDQLDHLGEAQLGYEKNNMMYLPVKGQLRSNHQVVMDRLQQQPGILSVTSSSSLPLDIGYGTESADWEGRPADTKVQMQILAVNYDFLDTYQMHMAQGRFFSEAYPSDPAEAVIVNEAAVRAMDMKEPIGKRLTDHFLDERDYRIIGVIGDFHYKSLHKPVEPLIIKIVPQWANYLSIRVAGDNIAGTIRSTEQIWDEFNPEYPFEYRFLESSLDQQYAAEQRMRQIFTYCTVLAIVIACLGLVGLASFMAETRTREIGIRKVLGASNSSIVVRFFKGFRRGTLIANIVAWPVAWYAMNQWLQTFVSRTDVGFETYLFASLLAMGLVLATVGIQAFRAATANPVNTLHCEG